VVTLELRHGDLSASALVAGQGPVVLCLHGFPDHARTFRHLLPALAAAGYRAIAPWMRGYEPKSQPSDGRYDVPALAGDVVAWLDQLKVERAHVVGHDWGAAVAYRLGQTVPDRLRSVTAMAVPWLGVLPGHLARSPRQVVRSWYMLFFQLPRLAEAALTWGDYALVRRLWRDWSPGFRLEDGEWQALRRTLSAPGVVAASLAYYRDAFRARSRAVRHWLAGRGRRVLVPTLALTGEEDGCLDTRLFDDWPRAAFPAGLRIERVARAGHFVHLERPELVNRRVVEWLRAVDSERGRRRSVRFGGTAGERGQAG
jgi:pimeloyl-ACP methyl ester carboxylesterase